MALPSSLLRGSGLALVAVAIATSAILLAGCGAGHSAHANLGWTKAACAKLVRWRNQLHHDETSLDLSFGPQARIDNAIDATHRLANQLSALGLPPARSNAAAVADLAIAALETKACRQLAGLPV